MPLPVAHSAAGLAGYLLFRKVAPKAPARQELVLLAVCLILANVQDVDFVLGFMTGDIGRFHHGPSHSLLVSIGMAMLTAMFAAMWLRGISKNRIIGSCIMSALSHPVLDYFSQDTSAPYGSPLFWPFEKKYYMSHFSLFMDVRREQDSIGSLLRSLINKHNGMEMVMEGFFAGLILFAIVGMQNRPRPRLAMLYFLLSLFCGVFYAKLHIQS